MGEPNVSVLEFGRIRDTVDTHIADGRHHLTTSEIADATGVEPEKVNETLLHLSRKHDIIEDAGAGRWRLTQEAVVEGDGEDAAA
jgi:DNA-binding IclR family transcriptional regulator